MSNRSLHSFCKEHKLPKSSVKTWLNGNGYDTAEGLTPEAEAAAMAEFVLMEAVAVDVQPETVGGRITQVQSRTNPLVPINIENLTINITTANTAQLQDETAHFQQVNAAALQGIGQYLQADLVATVNSQVAQNRHAVAGLGASAAVNLANSLGKAQADTAA